MDAPIPVIMSGAYTAINLVAFGVFTHDKVKAKEQSFRTPERTLLLLAAAGPFGAFAAMRAFRHKTRQPMFLLVPVFMVIHAVFLIWLPGLLMV